MPQSPPAGPYPSPRRSPRFVFDALVKLVVGPPDKLQQLWSRSTDISQGGIGVNLTAGELRQEELVSLQIPLPEVPLPKQHSVDLRASVVYRIGRHCGFEFLDLNEGQQTAIRTACEALARSQPRSCPPPA
jgi:c-di-GMP-binding flagellar brake protein YcgR